jgi:flagellar assembly factor FliW
MNTEALLEPQTQAVNGKVIIQLPFGLLGFEWVKKYALLANPQEDPFVWLQMLEGPKKAFLLVSPFLVVPDYQPDIPAADTEYLDLAEPADALVFNICTLRGARRATINLKGPIVINRHTMIGKQVVPNNSAEYALNHPLPIARGRRQGLCSFFPANPAKASSSMDASP